MKKQSVVTFLFLFLLGFSTFAVEATKKLPNVIISEAFLGYISEYGKPEFYMELTNLEDTTVSLEGFLVYARGGENRENRLDQQQVSRCLAFTSEHTIAPGATFTIATDYEGDDTGYAWGYGFAYLHPAMRAVADYVVDVVGGESNYIRCSSADECMVLAADLDGDGVIKYTVNSDPTSDKYQYSWGVNPELIDAVGDVTKKDGNRFPTVAGVNQGGVGHVLVRRPTVTKGNGGLFLQECGNSYADADWFPIPFNAEYGEVFNTIGSFAHNAFSLEGKAGKGITVNHTNKTIEMPWGASRNEVQSWFSFGENMAWDLIWNTNASDSSSFAMATGDKLRLYKVGINANGDLGVEDYTITVKAQTGAESVMIPSYFIFSRDNSGARLQQVPEYPIFLGEGVDTISLPFGVHRDTLMTKYVFPEGATVDIDYSNDAVRDLIYDGDELVITSKDTKSTTRYHIKSEPYVESANVNLKSLLTDAEESGKLEEIWNFAAGRRSYIVEMESDASTFPSVVIVLDDANATYKYTAPERFYGSKQDRTGVITVTSENGEVVADYEIEFRVFTAPSKVQPDGKGLIISQVNQKSRCLELCNVSNKQIDISKYMLYMTSGNNTGSQQWDNNNLIDIKDIETKSTGEVWDPTTHFKMRFGYARDTTKSTYTFVPNNYSKSVLEPGETYIIGQEDSPVDDVFDLDYNCGTSPDLKNNYDRYGYYDGNGIGYALSGASFWLIEITDEDVLNGSQALDTLSALKLVDVFGAVGTTNNHLVYGATDSVYDREYMTKIVRKPAILQGNPISHGSYGTTPANSEWIVTMDYDKYDHGMGAHNFTPSTMHYSVIAAEKYRVSLGFSESETIEGVAENTTAEMLMDNVIKVDAGQTLAVYRVDQEVKDAVKQGDILMVTSADGNNTTMYTVGAIEALSNDTELKSATYDITVEGVKGKVSGIAPLTTVSAFVAELDLPEGAIIILESADGSMVNALYLNTANGESLSTILEEGTVVNVIAEDGSRFAYDVEFGEITAPFIISTVYVIDQDKKIIKNFEAGVTLSGFIGNVTASQGAEVKVFNKAGGEITVASEPIAADYEIRVVKGDKSTVYTIEVVASLKDAKQARQFIAYPNPLDNELFINDMPVGASLTIYNMLGRSVLTMTVENALTRIDFSGVDSGIYVVSVKEDNALTTFRVLKK